MHPQWKNPKKTTATRKTLALYLMELLQTQGAIISYNDPHIATLPAMRNYQVKELASEPLTPEYLAGQDCILIATDHSEYDVDFIARHASLIVDTRNMMVRAAGGDAQVFKA